MEFFQIYNFAPRSSENAARSSENSNAKNKLKARCTGRFASRARKEEYSYTMNISSAGSRMGICPIPAGLHLVYNHDP